MKLRVQPKAESGLVQHVTPESAGWSYVGFDLQRLAPGEGIGAQTGEREVCLVFVAGTGRVMVDGKDLGDVGQYGYFVGCGDGNRPVVFAHLDRLSGDAASRQDGEAERECGEAKHRNCFHWFLLPDLLRLLIAEQVSQCFFMFWLRGLLLFGIGQHALRRWRAETFPGIRLHGLHDRELLFLRFAHSDT